MLYNEQKITQKTPKKQITQKNLNNYSEKQTKK